MWLTGDPDEDLARWQAEVEESDRVEDGYYVRMRDAAEDEADRRCHARMEEEAAGEWQVPA